MVDQHFIQLATARVSLRSCKHVLFVAIDRQRVMDVFKHVSANRVLFIILTSCPRGSMKWEVWVLREAIKWDTLRQALNECLSWVQKSSCDMAWLVFLRTPARVPTCMNVAQLQATNLRQKKEGICQEFVKDHRSPHAAMVG